MIQPTSPSTELCRGMSIVVMKSILWLQLVAFLAQPISTSHTLDPAFHALLLVPTVKRMQGLISGEGVVISLK